MSRPNSRPSSIISYQDGEYAGYSSSSSPAAYVPHDLIERLTALGITESSARYALSVSPRLELGLASEWRCGNSPGSRPTSWAPADPHASE